MVDCLEMVARGGTRASKLQNLQSKPERPKSECRHRIDSRKRQTTFQRRDFRVERPVALLAFTRLIKVGMTLTSALSVKGTGPMPSWKLSVLESPGEASTHTEYTAMNRKKKNPMTETCALLSTDILKLSPPASMVKASPGIVTRSRNRRPSTLNGPISKMHARGKWHSSHIYR
jgi:hypothetical protein